MERYYFTEVQNVNSRREPTETFYAASLTSAKRHASEIQMFQNTVIFIGTNLDANGHVIPVAYKQNRLWVNIENNA